MADEARAHLTHALEADDLAAIGALVRDHADLLNPPKGRPPITFARSSAAAELLLSHGADVEAAGKWCAPGFYTRKVAQDVARLLVARGADLSIHAAAGLGFVDRLQEMLAADPSLIDAKGGDGCTPLHFSRDIATAELLLKHGARIDARDEDHESTPAQWLIGDAPEVARFLLQRGAAPDIFLAVALGDRDLAEELIERDRGCLDHRIGRAPEFPPLGYNGRGGTIYQWSLAFNSYAHQVALLKGHEALFDFLYERSETKTRFLVSCVLARRSEAESIAASNPGIVSSLPPVDLELLPRYCWETNENYEAVKLMLDLGFPVAHPENTHGYSPLHNAAWSGSADLVDLLIARGHPTDLVDPNYNSTALGFAIYDATVERRHPEGDYGRVAKSLIDAGCPWDALDYPTGDASIDTVFESRMRERADGAAMLGDEAALNRLLGDRPAPDLLTQALAGAANGGHVALCRKLLAAGAPVNGSIGVHQVTPLMCAASSGSFETVSVFLEHGADVAAGNANGSTALHIAVAQGASSEIIELLLRSGAGALINVPNKFNYSPLRAAVERGRDDIVRLFRDF